MEKTQEKHEKWIKEFLTPTLIKDQKLIECENASEHIEVTSITIKPMSLAVAFMLTNCYFVKISIKIKHGHSDCKNADAVNERSFKIVVKFSPEVEPEMYELLCMNAMFSNEIAAYSQIIPKIESLSKSPKCLYSHNNPMEAVIVLSDFSVDGWKLSESKVNLSIDHILTAVKELGYFHGNMYAMKLTDADTFDYIKNKITLARFQEGVTIDDGWVLWLELGVRRATNSVRSSNEAKSIVPESFLQRLQEVLFGSYEYQTKRVRPVEPSAIICHGDYLRNNMAFRYDVDGKAIEAMMFDFQTMCYTSPMIDLCTFMANSTGHEVRDKYFDDIFAAYHKSLIAQFLSETKWAESDIPNYLSYDSLLREYATYLPFGISIASAFLQTLHDKDPPNFNEEPVKETVRQVFDKGGKVVDDELCSLVVHIYQLHKELNLSLEIL